MVPVRSKLSGLRAAIGRWVAARLSTPAGRLGATTAVIAGITAYVDAHGEPPVYLLGALTGSVGAWLAALGAKSQEQKEQLTADVKEAKASGERAEASAGEANDKADALGRVAAVHHPDSKDEITPPLPPTGGAAS